MVTITDIARRLGVAVSTVSKGLNGANDVSESTRALILKTAVEMGYAGRKVQKSGVRKVCVLAEREEFLSAGQFGYDLAMGFRTTAAQNGWQADLAPFQELLSSQEALDTFLLRHNYAGAFLIKQPLDSFFQANYLKNLINSAFPLVFWEEESNGPCSGSVGSDHRRGVFMAESVPGGKEVAAWLKRRPNCCSRVSRWRRTMVTAPKKSQTMPSRTTSAQSRHTATG